MGAKQSGGRRAEAEGMVKIKMGMVVWSRLVCSALLLCCQFKAGKGKGKGKAGSCTGQDRTGSESMYM